MLITIVNEAPEKVPNARVLTVIRAISRQIFHDFRPYWSLSAQLRLATIKSTTRQNLSPGRDAALRQLDPVSGGGVIRLRSLVDERIWLASHGEDKGSNSRFAGYSSPTELLLGTTARGFHFRLLSHNFPIAHVIVTDQNGEMRDDWTVTLSHEVLEMIANPYVNLRVYAPHPDPRRRRRGMRVYVHREVCDPVRQDEYEVDKERVANFVLPLYFLEGGHNTERVDFLGSEELESFGVNPGGYIPYFNPETGIEETYPSQPSPMARISGRSQDATNPGRALRVPL
jgi:hypothetical protein